MKRALIRYRNSGFRKFLKKHEKAALILFFVGGFIFDSLTLDRVDRLYDLIVLCFHMTLLTITLYLYNLADDGKWKGTFIEKLEDFFPIAIQFFFGGLSSAYVVYFSQSVSLSKTAAFFVILVFLLIANEFLKKRISNKYLQFSVYFFVSFTFFTFIIPVFVKSMSMRVFLISGLISLGLTLALITIIYKISPSTRAEIKKKKLLGIILTIYFIINGFYFLKLIPPVPLALKEGIVAHNVAYADNSYKVTYERDKWYVFWRPYNQTYLHTPGKPIYVFSSIFAPTDLKKSVFHRWKWYNENTESWETADNIGYDITGGRDGGFRGYTFKKNVNKGRWRVEVLTEEELLLGVVNFEVVINNPPKPYRAVIKEF